jgi:hypothetical protein
MLVRFGGTGRKAGLVFDVDKDKDGVSLRCLGGNSGHGTKREARALAKAIQAAVGKTKAEEEATT